MQVASKGKSLKPRNAKKAQSCRDKPVLKQALKPEAGKRDKLIGSKQGGDQLKVDVLGGQKNTTRQMQMVVTLTSLIILSSG